MKFEFIIQNGRDAIEAEKYGADRLEFVSAIGEGGLTPSYGTIKQVLESVSIPVYTMVRPHSNNFYYDESDLEIIKEDIKQIIKLGGKNIVVGALNKDNTINEEMLQSIISVAPDTEITFHRAFDETPSVIEAYRTLAKYKDHVKSILTSGGADNCLEGRESLSELVKLSNELNGPKILPGSGMSLENLKEIHSVVNAEQYHFGKAVRIDQSFAKGYDEGIIKKIKKELQ